MSRRLFCELCPLTYHISVLKCRLIRRIQDWGSGKIFAKKNAQVDLPVVIYHHNSLIWRRLGNVKMYLQENKAVNLRLAAQNINHILIHPGETFSFWRLVGNPSERKGYREGLTISSGRESSGIGGGMCQFTNLIHWMVLHTPLQVTEYHHHDSVDLFPDYNRQIPFGTGTSILYNYLDYQFYNPTQLTFELVAEVGEEYLCGQIRCDQALDTSYHIKTQGSGFVRKAGVVYRVGSVFQERIDKKTGNILSSSLIRENHARVMYDTSRLPVRDMDDVMEESE